VYRGGYSHFVLAGHHELQQGHLGRGILHRHTVGAEINIILTPAERCRDLICGQMGVKDLLGERQGTVKYLFYSGKFLAISGIDLFDHIDIESHDGKILKCLTIGIQKY